MRSLSAFVIGGTMSGAGKTTLTLGLMAAFKKRGLTVQPFKCGPDFIDPSLHHFITGTVSRNLDMRMAGDKFCRNTFAARSSGCDVAVVEGVMGLFDGGVASSATLAKQLKIPVVLVIDVRSAAESVAAVVKGFELYDPDLSLRGIIFNRVASARHRELIENAVHQITDIPILGFFPGSAEITIPERHLGLFMGDESPLDQHQLALLIQQIEEHIDIDRLLEVSSMPAAITSRGTVETKMPPSRQRLNLGVARDSAFCFYYQDNFDILEEAGFDLHYFSPLKDTRLPDGMDCLYFGGGYPELHAAKLAANGPMLQSIAAFAKKGGAIYGECGGFMYLTKGLIDLKGNQHPMVGIFPFTVRMNARLRSLGYRHVVLQKRCILGHPGESLYGHEFHYSDIELGDSSMETLYRVEGEREEGYRVGNVLGSYIHLHFGQTRSAVDHLFKTLLGQKRVAL